jgi:hypothetical protein
MNGLACAIETKSRCVRDYTDKLFHLWFNEYVKRETEQGAESEIELLLSVRGKKTK